MPVRYVGAIRRANLLIFGDSPKMGSIAGADYEGSIDWPAVDGFWGTVYSEAPTTPCVSLRLFTVNLFLRPPLFLGLGRGGWHVAPQSAAQAALCKWDAAYVEDRLLDSTKIVISAEGPFGRVNRTVPLHEHLLNVERGLRSQLELGGDAPDTPQPSAAIGVPLALAPQPLDVD